MGVEQDHVAANLALQLRRRAQADQVAVAQDGQAVAFFGLFHQVRGHDDGDALLVAQNLQVLPEVAARAGIEAGGGLIEQQNLGTMEQSLGQFETALHAAGEGFGAVLGAIGEGDALQHFRHALLQRRAGDSVEMADVDEVLLRRKLHVDAARLEDHADLAAHAAGIQSHVVAQNQSASGGGQHQGGKNAEHGGLAAAVGAEQTEDLGAIHGEGDAVEGDAIAVLMAQAVDLNDRPGAASWWRRRVSCSCVLVVKSISPQLVRAGRCDHAALFSIISAKSKGR